jgi:arCOG04150 universal archaeal PUA-domain protein
MRVKSRHHLRSDEVRAMVDRLGDRVGVDLDGETYERVDIEGSAFDLVLVDGDPDVVYVDDEPFPTVRGANRHDPDRRLVTVDAGAISFVSDGADVMRPGIVDADETVAEGDLVLVAEETHGKVLAVGRALVDGASMPGDTGRVVESVHHVGDDLYAFSV